MAVDDKNYLEGGMVRIMIPLPEGLIMFMLCGAIVNVQWLLLINTFYGVVIHVSFTELLCSV